MEPGVVQGPDRWWEQPGQKIEEDGKVTETPSAARRPAWPPASWPSGAQLDYAQKLITVLILVLALPYVLGKLLTDPAGLVRSAGAAKVKS